MSSAGQSMGQAFAQNLHQFMIGYRAQLAGFSVPVGDATEGDVACLLAYSHRPLTKAEARAFPPVVITVNDETNGYRTLAELPFVYESAHRALETGEDEHYCSFTLETAAMWTANPRVPFTGSVTLVPPRYGMSDYASRSGVKYPWIADDLRRIVPGIEKEIADEFVDIDISGRSSGIRVVSSALATFSGWLKRISLPSVGDVIYSGASNGAAWGREGVDQLVGRASLHDYAACVRQLSRQVIIEIERSASQFVDSASLSTHYATERVGAKTSALCARLIARLIRVYVNMRYSGIAILYDGLCALFAYLRCPELVAYGSFVPRLSTKEMGAMDHRDADQFSTFLVRNGPQEPVLPIQASMCRDASYLIGRMRGERTISEGLAAIRHCHERNEEIFSRTPNAMVYGLFTALSWRFICIAMLFPMFNFSDRKRPDWAPAALHIFNDSRLSSNASESQTRSLTPGQIVAMYHCAFQWNERDGAGEVEILLPGTPLKSTPFGIAYKTTPNYRKTRRQDSTTSHAAPTSSSSASAMETDDNSRSLSPAVGSMALPSVLASEESSRGRRQLRSSGTPTSSPSSSPSPPPSPVRPLSSSIRCKPAAKPALPSASSDSEESDREERDDQGDDFDSQSTQPPGDYTQSLLEQMHRTSKTNGDSDDDEDDDDADDVAVPNLPVVDKSRPLAAAASALQAQEKATSISSRRKRSADEDDNGKEADGESVAPPPTSSSSSISVPRKRLYSTEDTRSVVKNKLRKRWASLIGFLNKVAAGKKQPRGGRHSCDYRDWIRHANRLWASWCIQNGWFYAIPAVTNPAHLSIHRGVSRGASARVGPLVYIPDLDVVPAPDAMPPLVSECQRSDLNKQEIEINGDSDTSVETVVRMIRMHIITSEPIGRKGRGKRANDGEHFSLAMVIAIHFYWINYCQAEFPRIKISDSARHKLVRRVSVALGMKDARVHVFAFVRNSPYFQLAARIDAKAFRVDDCFSGLSTPYLHAL